MLKAKLNYLNIKTSTSDIPLLKNIEFNLKRNSINTILGKNGSGKTSFILVLTNLLNNSIYDYSITVELFEQNLFNLSRAELEEYRRKNIRYVFQDPIGSFDPLKKIKYYFDLLNIEKTEIEMELDLFRLPSYNRLIKMHSYELSVGMAQRINLVLSVLAKPKLLILDEPTSALDLPFINLLVNRLKEFAAKNENIVLVVTQDISFAKTTSDFISLLSEKQLSGFYSTENFFNNNQNEKINKFIDFYNKLVE